MKYSKLIMFMLLFRLVYLVKIMRFVVTLAEGKNNEVSYPFVPTHVSEQTETQIGKQSDFAYCAIKKCSFPYL